MVDISHPVTRSRKTDIAGSVVVTPSGGSTGTPIVAADLVNGFAPITLNFAAGETVKNAVFAVVDDSLIEGPETYRLTLSNPQPSGTFDSGAFVEATLADNDAAQANIFGPLATADTGYLSADTEDKVRFTGTLDDTSWEIHFGGTTNTGRPTCVVKAQAIDRTQLQFIEADGKVNNSSEWTYRSSPAMTGGKAFTFDWIRSTGRVKMVMDGVTVYEGGTGFGLDASSGAWLRLKTGGAQRPSITIAKFS